MRRMLEVVCLLVVGLMSSARGEGREAPVEAAVTEAHALESDEVLAWLLSMPDVYVVSEVPSGIPDTRFFRLYFAQPLDHADPDSDWFWLRATLLHRSLEAPTVLYSTGYASRAAPSRAEPTELLDANQLSLEHRFYGVSRPSPLDWRRLDIAQAANDYHRVIQAFKPMYPGRWLTTGASKGGMAAVYHRYFFPEDVDATVAYATPSLQGPVDDGIARFLEQVGTPACRERLRAFQREALLRRDELVALLVRTGMTFHQLGADRALEFAIVETPFYFFQYEDPSRCERIPGREASSQELLDFVDEVTAMETSFADLGVSYYAPYYYQSATQLGYPSFPTRHLRGLLRYPGEDVPATYLSFPVEAPFSQDLLRHVERWTRDEAERLLFIHGGSDPWSTRPYEVRESNDSHLYVVPGGHHGNTLLRSLAEPERTHAMTRLFQWMDVKLPAQFEGEPMDPGGEDSPARGSRR
ncbi:PS-10 peptidase S37 [Myxococcus fulvus]|uniref:PS-10 peptidase S37 n=2 Tax=Myxococcus fulvus TaxID=33 RepID=A0ABY1CU99_MYXFU|nr:S28 family serine protease [Myxococcus fulvus]SEU37541.1 PS-10 peptidase S37 [Myxococcus fulvus]